MRSRSRPAEMQNAGGGWFPAGVFGSLAAFSGLGGYAFVTRLISMVSPGASATRLTLMPSFSSQ